MNNIQLLIERDGTQVTVAGLNTTTTWSSFITTVQNALNTGTSGWTVEVDGADQGTTTLASKTTFFRIKRPGDTDKSFLGDIAATASGLDEGAFIACYADSGLISLRRGAGAYYRVGDLTLKGNETGTSRKANFGVLMCSTQFIGHVIERIHAAYFESVFGILKGTGNNGEQIRFDRLYGSDCKKGFFCDAPQAFLQEFRGWYLGLDNDGVYLDLADADPPGYGIGLLDCHATFGDGGNPDGKGTLVRVRRGTGIVQWTGGRIEHMATLFDYDALDGQGPNESLDLIFRGVEFDATLNQAGADPSRPFVHGTGSTGSATQYGLVVDTCRFASSAATSDAAKTDLLLKATSPGLRCTFVRSRFDGFRSIRTEGLEAEFDRCYRSDFSTPGATGNRLREFTEVSGTPGQQTQSRRVAWQDTPWIQTGPRVNVLKNSDLALQTPGTDKSCNASPWTLSTAAEPGTSKNFAAFGKWGQSGIGGIGDVSPGPESFGFKLTTDSSLRNTLDFVDLSLSGSKVVTYQALVRVSGSVRFRLVNSASTGSIFDEVGVSGTGSALSAPTLVTLRAQVASSVSGSPQLRIENVSGSDATVQVVWQQAWTGGGNSLYSVEDGLRNFAQVRTPSGEVTENTYVWGVNATSVRAAQRFQFPVKEEAFGWLAQVLTGMDLRDGETYWDNDQVGLVMRHGATWFMLQQPERFRRNTTSDTMDWAKGDEKNLVSLRIGLGNVTVDIDDLEVIGGTVVRVYRTKPVSGTTKAVVITASSTTYDPLDEDHMAEFVFDGAAGVWVCTQFNVATK
jgi:hypothetical protein